MGTKVTINTQESLEDKVAAKVSTMFKKELEGIKGLINVTQGKGGPLVVTNSNSSESNLSKSNVSNSSEVSLNFSKNDASDVFSASLKSIGSNTSEAALMLGLLRGLLSKSDGSSNSSDAIRSKSNESLNSSDASLSKSNGSSNSSDASLGKSNGSTGRGSNVTD